MSKTPNILLIYTGGTIGMIKDFETGALRNFNFDELLNHIPELKLLDCNITTTSFPIPIDSSNMNPEYWVAIANLIESNYESMDGFVVLHGSDTMSCAALGQRRAGAVARAYKRLGIADGSSDVVLIRAAACQ